MRQKEIIKQQQDPNCLIERKEAKKKKKKRKVNVRVPQENDERIEHTGKTKNKIGLR